MLKLNEVHSLKLLCFVFDCSRGSTPEPFNNLFTPVHQVHNYNTRQASNRDIFISSVNTTQYGKRSARFAGAVLWNNLPLSIKSAHSSNIFKKQLRDFYVSLYSS